MTRRRVLQAGCVAHVYDFCMSRCSFESLSNAPRLCACNRTQRCCILRYTPVQSTAPRARWVTALAPTQDRCAVANPDINRYTQHSGGPPWSRFARLGSIPKKFTCYRLTELSTTIPAKRCYLRQSPFFIRDIDLVVIETTYYPSRTELNHKVLFFAQMAFVVAGRRML